MAMKIDQSRIDSGDLTPQEIYYLQSRGRLPSHISPVSKDAATGELRASGLHPILEALTIEETEALLADKIRKRDQSAATIRDKGGIVEKYDDEIQAEENELMRQRVRAMLDSHTEQDLVETAEANPEADETAEALEEPMPEDPEVAGYVEDYEDGWSNVARRTELARRNLSVNGGKAELIDRLLRSDRDELTEADNPPAM